MPLILIADDHPLVRQGLRQVLEAHDGLRVVGEAKDGDDAMALAGRLEWDVAVVDYNMPGKSGVELVKELRRRHPERPVLVLSMYPEDRYALRLLKAGAAGYLNKESAPEELVGALHKVAAGGRYVSAALGEKLALAMAGDGEEPAYEKLSDREYQIMWLLASGKTVGDIARQLFLSANTVSTYRARILKKLEVRNNAELMRYAIRHQLVD
jgi:DNA-binding NarL/FixJ family response regulator